MAASKKHRRADLLDHLLNFLKTHVSPGQRLLLGLSGGLDSCVLLDLLIRAREHFDFQLSAIHVNHGISPNAAEWAEFCDKLCSRRDISCHIAVIDVPRDTGLGIEAAAREARYSAMAACDEEIVIMAHHRDDQAETVLLQLLRGAGAAGVAAMPVMRMDQGKVLLRPLLDISRTQLHDYAHEHELAWIDDESNLDLAYDRNFLRHQIVPALEGRFSAAKVNLARSANHLGEAAALMEELAEEDGRKSINHSNQLDLGYLRSLSLVRAKNLLRWWLKREVGEVPNTAQLDQILKQLIHASADAQPRIDLGRKSLLRYRDRVYLESIGNNPFCIIDWHGQDALDLGKAGSLSFRQGVGDGISLGRIAGAGLNIRFRHGGERFRVAAKRPMRSLKNLFQEAGIPPWRRDLVPLIYCHETLIMIPIIGITDEYRANKEELSLMVAWHAPC